ncbi:uncharacterized protein ACO6RY_11618 [Pungitius sinensis]
MGFKRCVLDRIRFLLLILGTIATDASGQSLQCTNDFIDTVSCHFNAQNCTEYSFTLEMPENRAGAFTQCDDGQCCGSITNMILVSRETHTVTVWKGDNILESKNFSVNLTIKPRAPTIRSVKQFDGNFKVTWDTNVNSPLRSYLKTNMTYHKKGDTKKVSRSVQPSTLDGSNVFNILGQDLEPSTTYVVSVRSYTDFSGIFSDRSNEMEFTTAMSPVFLPLIVIISLCFAAVVITSVIYVSYVKVKTKWWIAVSKCPNPKLGVIYPSTQKVLKPGTTDYSVVSVEPLVPDDNKSWLKRSLGNGSTGSLDQSSGISTGSSCISYPDTERDIKACVSDALKHALTNIVPFSTTEEVSKASGLPPAPQQPCQADDVSSGAFSFDNRTYSIVIPTDISQVQTQAEIPCDSAYNRRNADPQPPSCLLVNLALGDPSLMPTDMSYRPCNADSGGFSYAEALSSSPVSSGTNSVALCDAVSSLESRCERYEEAVCGAMRQQGKDEGLAPCEEPPRLTAGSHGFPPVEDGYQPFESQAALPRVLFANNKEGHLNKYPEELFTVTPQSLSSPGVACGAPLCLMPADPSGPLMSEPGYQRV